MTTAKITRCNHYFHGVCLRKWLYVQDRCPLCHEIIMNPDDSPVTEGTPAPVAGGQGAEATATATVNAEDSSSAASNSNSNITMNNAASSGMQASVIAAAVVAATEPSDGYRRREVR